MTLRVLPKAELHLHAGGAFPLSFLEKHATPAQFEKLQQVTAKILQGIEYELAFEVFPIISAIVSTNALLEQGILAICQAAHADGVKAIEIRTGLKKLDGSEEDYLKACLKGIKQSPVKCVLILSVRRDSKLDEVKTTLALARTYRNEGIVGIDISGISTRGDIRPFLDLLQEAKRDGFKIAAHVGESYKETDQLLILETLQPDRVGHGVCLNDEAKKWILQNKTPVEVCITSAIASNMHKKEDRHPWLNKYKEQGHPIVICSDDPTVFGTLTEEYRKLLGFLSMDEITKLAQESFKHSFIKS